VLNGTGARSFSGEMAAGGSRNATYPRQGEKHMDRPFGFSRTSSSSRSSESRSSEERTTSPRDQNYEKTVGGLVDHQGLGTTHSGELDKLRGLKVLLSKLDGNLTVKVPEGVSDSLREALQEAIENPPRQG
jgi:hypothetical protein